METRFWKRFLDLCERNDLYPTEAAIKCGLGNSVTTRWKSGSLPRGKSLKAIADFFHVSEEYLLGYDDTEPFEVSKEERKIIEAFRNQPEMHDAVRKLLFR